MVTQEGRPGQMESFASRLRRRAREHRSWLCIGLDPDLSALPQSVPATSAGVVRFCQELIRATEEYAVCYKINFAFFEVLGPDAWSALEAVRSTIPLQVPVIADAKRGDIANTAAAYARSVFDNLQFDAVTLSPYLGWDSLAPFLGYAGKLIFVLCRTSNPGSHALQNLTVEGEPLYLRVGREALSLPGSADVGLVVGATHLEPLRSVRRLSEEAILLIPGVGAQGGTCSEARGAGANRAGDNALLSVSRQVSGASQGSDFASAASKAARALRPQTCGDP